MLKNVPKQPQMKIFSRNSNFLPQNDQEAHVNITEEAK